MVVWTDTFNDYSKIAAHGRTFLDNRYSNFIQGQPIVEYCWMGTTAAVNAVFNDIQTSPSASWDCLSTIKAVSGEKALMMGLGTTTGSCEIGKSYTEVSTDYVGGWKQYRARMYLYCSTALQASGVIAKFAVKFIEEGQQGEAAQKIYEYGIKYDYGVNNDYFLVTRSDTGSSQTWANSGIAYPSGDDENSWVKLEIHYNSHEVTYIIDDVKVTSYHPYLENMSAGVHTYIIGTNTTGSTVNIWWDSFTDWSAIEHNDDEDLYPDHDHSFTTNDIGVSSKWRTLKITPFHTGYIPDGVKVLWTIYDESTDDPITGYINRSESTASLANLSATTHPNIYIKFKIYDETDLGSEILKFIDIRGLTEYVTWKIEQIDIYFEAVESRVSVACISNEYNDDIVTPIVTKTGYSLIFRVTVADYYTIIERKEGDEDRYPVAYWIDFGDGTSSGWIYSTETLHIYTKHSLNTSEAGADQEWNVKARTMWDNGEISDWSDLTLDVSVLNAEPVAMLITRPKRVRMSGIGIATVFLYGGESYDIDDNGTIKPSGGYMFDFDDGDSPFWQDASYASNEYDTAGLYQVGLTVKDDKDAVSEKALVSIRILPPLTATLLSFELRPRQIDSQYTFGFETWHTIAGGYPQVEPDNTKNRTLTIAGQGHNEETDITMLLGLAETHSLVALQYIKIGGAVATVVGYITSLGVSRGQMKYDAPWNMQIQYLDGITPGDDTLTGIMKFDEGSSLPSASEDYVNTYFRVLGGTGVEDIGYLCVKNSSNVYEWVQIVTGSS